MRCVMLPRRLACLRTIDPLLCSHGTINAVELLLTVIKVLFSRDYGETQLALNFSGGLIGQIFKDLQGTLSPEATNTLLQVIATLSWIGEGYGGRFCIAHGVHVLFAAMQRRTCGGACERLATDPAMAHSAHDMNSAVLREGGGSTSVALPARWAFGAFARCIPSEKHKDGPCSPLMALRLIQMTQTAPHF